MPRLPLALATLLVASAATAAAPADDATVARQMIQALDAYAVYKMGHFEEAYRRYRALAEAGNHQGMLNLANMLAAGEGTAADPAEALAWYRRAAEDGSAIGMYELARAYELGIGSAPDPARAAAWYRRAADADNPDAQWWLGQHLLAQGDSLEGLAWIRSAAFDGEQPDAQAFLDNEPQTASDETTRARAGAVLAQLDAAIAARSPERIAALLAADARIRLRLPGQGWQDMDREGFRQLWSATFAQAPTLHYRRLGSDVRRSGNAVLASSEIVETFAPNEPPLQVRESLQLDLEAAAPIRALRLEMRRED